MLAMTTLVVKPLEAIAAWHMLARYISHNESTLEANSCLVQPWTGTVWSHP